MRLALAKRFALAAIASVTLPGVGVVASAEVQAQAPAPAEDPTPEAPVNGEPAAEPGGGIEGGGFDEYEKAEDKRKAATPEWGAGLRLRGVFVPKGFLELFVDEAASGIFHPGIGLEINRRKQDFELVMGLEYEGLSGSDGYWLEKGDDPLVPGQSPDLVEFDDLAWVTADVTFVFHTAINPQISFRYGAGLGLGLVLGDVYQTDSICSGRDIQDDCVPNPAGEQVHEAADVPPVFPVVNLLAGAQYRPTEKIAINLDVGMRTLFFFGLSSTLYFDN